MFEFWLMGFIIFEINILKEMGIGEKSVIEQENPYQSFIRVNIILFLLINDLSKKINRKKLIMTSKKKLMLKLNSSKRILMRIRSLVMKKMKKDLKFRKKWTTKIRPQKREKFNWSDSKAF